MAKKLTDEQLKILGDKLIDTKRCATEVCSELFGREITPAEESRLARIGRMFECTECCEWKANDVLSTHWTAMCVDCAESFEEELDDAE